MRPFTPTRFLKLSHGFIPWLFPLTLLSAAWSLYWIFARSPADYLQGDAVRILYIHVPAAWFSLGLYAFAACGSFVFYIWRVPMAFFIARSAGWVGLLMTTICLATGALWGKPTWGTWWVWDARLTSVLILWFLYGGFLCLSYAFQYKEQGWRAAALLNCIGLLNLPIIKFSVHWWTTLHQGASFNPFKGTTVHETMLWPLLFMLITYGLYSSVMLLWITRAQIIQEKRHAWEVRA